MNAASAAPAKKQEKASSGYTMEEVAKHTKKGDVWVVLHGRVLNVSNFFSQHPGSELAILTFACKDATAEFDMIHPDVVEKYVPDSVLVLPIEMHGAVATRELVLVREWESLNAKGRAGPYASRQTLSRDNGVVPSITSPSRRKYPDGNKQSHAGESYQRATTQEPIIDGGSLVSPGLATQRDRGLTATASCPDAVGWAPLVGQAR